MKNNVLIIKGLWLALWFVLEFKATILFKAWKLSDNSSQSAH